METIKNALLHYFFLFLKKFWKKKNISEQYKKLSSSRPSDISTNKMKNAKKKHFISYPLTPYVLCMQVIVVELYQTVHILNNICKFTLWVFSTRMCSHFTSPHTDFEVIQYFTKELQSFVWLQLEKLANNCTTHTVKVVICDASLSASIDSAFVWCNFLLFI